MVLSKAKSRLMTCVRTGVEVCTLVGATWHWSDLTFIEPSVVKLDYGKVSASDISRFIPPMMAGFLLVVACCLLPLLPEFRGYRSA